MNGPRLIAVILLGVGGFVVGCTDSPGSEGGSQQQPMSAPPRASGFAVTSPAFADGARMPSEHVMPAAGGRNVSVPLEWSSPPTGTVSFAIEVVDLHPIAHRWVHWLVVDIPADTRGLQAGASGSSMPQRARELVNSFGLPGWDGPQPPKGTGQHDYRITVFALDTPMLDLPDDASLDEFRKAAEEHALTSASLVGTFER